MRWPVMRSRPISSHRTDARVSLRFWRSALRGGRPRPMVARACTTASGRVAGGTDKTTDSADSAGAQAGLRRPVPGRLPFPGAT